MMIEQESKGQMNGTKAKLEQEEIEINMDDSLYKKEKKTQIHDKAELASGIQISIQNMKKLIQIVNSDKQMEKYLSHARTTTEELLNSLKEIKKQFEQIKHVTENQQINITILGDVIRFFNYVFAHNEIEKMQTIDKCIWILQFQSKISCCMKFILCSLKLQDDITTLPKQKCENTWKNIRFDSLGDPQKLKQNFKGLKKMLGITTSAVISEESKDWNITKIITFGLSYPKYFLSNKKCQLKALRFYRKPEVHMAKKIWNLPENGMTREMVKLKLKGIVTNQKIYIPIERNEVPESIYFENKDSIQVRILHNEDMIFKNRGDERMKSKVGFCCTSSTKQYENISTIILHMHGGGFIALSSRSMQTYTRRWAKKLNVPVFSIDYRMPPENRFPSAPYDCLRVYEFLINHIHKYMNVKPKKIILAGDSAGGNLVFSLNALIMKNKLPPPYGLYAAYPAADIRKTFSPSKIHAFTDPLLYPSMLLLCLREYTGEDEELQKDPIASPVLLTQQYLNGEEGNKSFPKEWPKTRIQVGAKDPLYDDSLKIMQKMSNSGVDCYCQVYENLPHGFLNLDFMIPDCEKTITDSIEHLNQLML